MLTFILRRLLAGVVLIFVISSVAFLLLYAGSGDIARRILGQSATAQNVSDKAASLGLNRSVFSQYFDWLGHAIHGDLGASWFTGQPVTAAITSRLAVTLSLVIGATVVVAIVSVVLGVWARGEARPDRQHRPVGDGAGLRDPRLPDRPRAGHGVRAAPRLVQAHRVRQPDRLGHRLARVGHVADHRAGHRRYRRRHRPGPRRGDRRGCGRTTSEPSAAGGFPSTGWSTSTSCAMPAALPLRCWRWDSSACSAAP